MITRIPLRILVFALPLLLITFAISLGTGALFRVLGDEPVARVFSTGGLVLGVLLAVDVVLLVGCLGLRAVLEDESKKLGQTSPP